MTTRCIRLLCTLGALTCLSACAPVAGLIGYGAGPYMQVAATVDRIKLAGDGVSYLGSGKTITDHAVSMMTGEDCHLLNVVKTGPVCVQPVSMSALQSKTQLNLAAMHDKLGSPDGATTALDVDAKESEPGDTNQTPAVEGSSLVLVVAPNLAFPRVTAEGQEGLAPMQNSGAAGWGQ